MIDYLVMFACCLVCAAIGYWRCWRSHVAPLRHEIQAYKLALRDRDKQIAKNGRSRYSGLVAAWRAATPTMPTAKPQSSQDEDDYPQGVGA